MKLKKLFKSTISVLLVFSFLILLPVQTNANTKTSQVTANHYKSSLYNDDTLGALGIALKLGGYKYSGDFLINSALKNSSDLYYSSNSALAKKIKTTDEYVDMYTMCKTKIKNNKNATSLIYYWKDSFESDTDLFGAIHNFDYKVKAVKVNNAKWTVTMTITDTYNFEYNSWYGRKSLKGYLTTISNNLAFWSQKSKSAKIYNVTIDISANIYL